MLLSKTSHFQSMLRASGNTQRFNDREWHRIVASSLGAATEAGGHALMRRESWVQSCRRIARCGTSLIKV